MPEGRLICDWPLLFPPHPIRLERPDHAGLPTGWPKAQLCVTLSRKCVFEKDPKYYITANDLIPSTILPLVKFGKSAVPLTETLALGKFECGAIPLLHDGVIISPFPYCKATD